MWADYVVQHAALLEVHDEGSHGLVGIAALRAEFVWQVGAGLFDVGPVEVESGLRFLAHVGQFWYAGLEAIGHFILGYAGLDVRVAELYPVSWVSTYGKGKTCYCSLGHDGEMFRNPVIVQHYLAGIQYALGELPADATLKAVTMLMSDGTMVARN